jgi:hypothetical protein
MKSCCGLCKAQSWTNKRPKAVRSRKAVFCGACLAISLLLTGAFCKAPAQAVPAGTQQGLAIYAGATGSGQYLQYGERQMIGITGFVDADTRHHLGYTAEGSWIIFHQTAGLHTSTFEGGLRYRLSRGKLEPYVKALAGIGEYTAPYNLANGSFLVVTGGGGIDYNLGHRIRLRVADFEYTYWPQFTPSSAGDVVPMSTMTVSTGIKIRIF